jgi:hypothetical protein
LIGRAVILEQERSKGIGSLFLRIFTTMMQELEFTEPLLHGANNQPIFVMIAPQYLPPFQPVIEDEKDEDEHHVVPAIAM